MQTLLTAVLAIALLGLTACGQGDVLVTRAQPPKVEDQDARLAANPARPASAVVQLFNWPFDAVRGELCSLRADGYSHVHVSPPTLSNSAPDWWARYQPLDLRRIEGPLGSEAQFSAMIAEASRCGIAIVVDVVLNHAANVGFSSNDLYYPPGCDRSTSAGANGCLWRPEQFNQQQCIFDYNSHCAVLYGRICGGPGDQGLPDLNTGYCEPGGRLDIRSRNYDSQVFAAARTYLLRLIALGATGIRIDAAKHMHPAFLEDLLRTPGIDGRAWAFAEVIASSTNDPALSAYRHIGGLDFMDFPLTRSLQNAFAFGGSLRGLRSAEGNGLALDGPASVAFVTNHDVWGNEGGLGYRFSSFQDELLASIYVLGKESGIPYVYSELPEQSQSRRYRSEGESYVYFHRLESVRQMVRFHAEQLGKPQRWAWEDDVHLGFARGVDGFVAVNKAGEPWRLDGIDLLLTDGTYEDALSGQRFVLRNGRTQGEVPARWGRMLVRLGP